MDEKTRRAAEKARGQSGKSTSASNGNNTHTNRANSRGSAATGDTKQRIKDMADNIGDQMTEQLMYFAWQRVSDNLQQGKYGDRIGQFLDSMEQGMHESLSSGIEEELDPKYLLPSSSKSNDEYVRQAEGIEIIVTASSD